MNRSRRIPLRSKRVLILLVISFLLTPLSAQAAPGSWVTESTGVRLFTPGRMVESKPLTPPEVVPAQAQIRQIRWRYRAPSGWPQPEAWLCHPQRCIPLSQARGRSKVLAGLSADAPLYFRFRLPKQHHSSKPQRVEELQVIVDYD